MHKSNLILKQLGFRNKIKALSRIEKAKYSISPVYLGFFLVLHYH